jgi:hypothetical protein
VSRWYRAYEGTVTDAKLAEAAMVADVSRAVSIAAWHCLLESAACVNNCGSYETSSRRVSIILFEPPAAIEALFAAYAELGLIGDGAVLSWKKRQFHSDDSRVRVAEHRARKRQKTADVTAGNDDVTECNAPETETDTDSSVAKATSPRPWALPVGVSPQVWADLLANRKRKRACNTPTAWKKFQDDLTRISLQTGIPPPKLIEHAAASGWAGIYDPNEHKGRSYERSSNPTGDAVSNVLRRIGADDRTRQNAGPGCT